MRKLFSNFRRWTPEAKTAVCENVQLGPIKEIYCVLFIIYELLQKGFEAGIFVLEAVVSKGHTFGSFKQNIC